jgi:hypothetical protein
MTWAGNRETIAIDQLDCKKMLIPRNGSNVIRIPASALVSFESLNVYTAMVLEGNFGSLSRIENTGDQLNTPYIWWSNFKDADKDASVAVRGLYKLSSDWNTNGKPIWENVTQFDAPTGGTAPLSRFLTT